MSIKLRIELVTWLASLLLVFPDLDQFLPLLHERFSQTTVSAHKIN